MKRNRKSPAESFSSNVLERILNSHVPKQEIVKPMQSSPLVFKITMLLGILSISVMLITFISSNYGKYYFVDSLALLMLVASAFGFILFFKWIKKT